MGMPTSYYILRGLTEFISRLEEDSLREQIRDPLVAAFEDELEEHELKNLVGLLKVKHRPRTIRERALETAPHSGAIRLAFVNLLLRLDASTRAALRDPVKDSLREAPLDPADLKMVLELLPTQRGGVTIARRLADLERENRQFRVEIQRLHQMEQDRTNSYNDEDDNL